jgi:hypothetical protein
MSGTAEQVSVDMTTDERAVMDGEDVALSAAARVALETVAPNPGGVPAWWLTCSVDVARELLAAAEAGAARSDPAKSALFRSAARQVRFGLWKIEAGPAP